MMTSMRVGILDDLSAGPSASGSSDVERWLRFAADELIERGRLDRPVEFVHSWGLGLPAGSATAVERAYEELVGQDVLLIVGPAVGDNALVATPLAERYRVPTLNWAGAERARSDYMFQLQVGSHEDESIVIARHLAACAVQHIGVVHDLSPIGERHLQFLQAEAAILGLSIDAVAGLSPLAEEATAQVDQLLASRLEALVYLGLGLSAPAVATALSACGWNGIRVMNTAGIRGIDPAFARLIDRWIYLDMHSDDNRTLAALRQRRNLSPRDGFRAATRYDLGRLVAEALARAPGHTREGLKQGLERVKWLPAAEGHEGTLLGFGVWERGALHGRYLVLRQWADGRSVEVTGHAGAPS